MIIRLFFGWVNIVVKIVKNCKVLFDILLVLIIIGFLLKF